MQVNGPSSVQAAFAAVLLTQGRERAESMFTRLMVAGGAQVAWHDGALAALLFNGGLPASVATPPVRDAGRLYDMARLHGWLVLGVWQPEASMGAVVWGLTYQKPCKCAGLCFFMGDRPRPLMGTPHRNKYLGIAVVVKMPIAVHWPTLDNLPQTSR